MKYGCINLSIKFLDEPALIFRRNAFLTIEEESQITDVAVLNILLMEARLNIQQGNITL